METPNLNYIKELSGGDQLFEDKLKAILSEEFPLEIQEYQENLQKERFQAAAANVHKIKHKIGMLGLNEGYEFTITYEEMLKANDCSQKDRFQAILNTIQEFITTF